MRRILEPWKQLRLLPRSVWVLAGVSLINRAGTMVVPFLILYLTRHLGFTPAHAGALFALYGLASLVAAPIAGRLCDRFGSVRVMAVSLTLSSLVMLVYPLASTVPQVALATGSVGVTVFAVASPPFHGRSMPPIASGSRPWIPSTIAPILGSVSATISPA